MASNITVDTLTKGSTTLNTDEIVDTNSSQVCKAWVNFNGQASPISINNAFNVSSITDNGAGNYYVNFTTSMSHSEYSVSGNGANSDTWGYGRYVSIADLTTTRCKVNSTYEYDQSQDAWRVCVQIFSN